MEKNVKIEKKEDKIPKFKLVKKLEIKKIKTEIKKEIKEEIKNEIGDSIKKEISASKTSTTNKLDKVLIEIRNGFKFLGTIFHQNYEEFGQNEKKFKAQMIKKEVKIIVKKMSSIINLIQLISIKQLIHLIKNLIIL